MKKIDIEKQLSLTKREKVIDQKYEIELDEFSTVKELVDYLTNYMDWDIISEHSGYSYNSDLHFYIVNYRDETDLEFEKRKKKLEKEWTNINNSIDKQAEKNKTTKEARIKKLEAELAKLKKS